MGLCSGHGDPGELVAGSSSGVCGVNPEPDWPASQWCDFPRPTFSSARCR